MKSHVLHKMSESTKAVKDTKRVAGMDVVIYIYLFLFLILILIDRCARRQFISHHDI